MSGTTRCTSWRAARRPITALSGGNQQKIIIARGFASGASLVLLDDPTRG